jgi:hypothetical protein
MLLADYGNPADDRETEPGDPVNAPRIANDDECGTVQGNTFTFGASVCIAPKGHKDAHHWRFVR